MSTPWSPLRRLVVVYSQCELVRDSHRQQPELLVPSERRQKPEPPRLPIAGPDLRQTKLTAMRGSGDDGREVRWPLA